MSEASRTRDNARKLERHAAGLCVHCGQRPATLDHPNLVKYPPHVRRWCTECVTGSLNRRADFELEWGMSRKAASKLHKLGLPRVRPAA